MNKYPWIVRRSASLMVSLLFVYSSFSIAAAEDAATTLIGRWEAEERSPAGIGSVLGFEANGEVKCKTFSLVDLKYTASDLTNKKAGPIKTSYEIESDKIVDKSQDGKVIVEWSRVGEKSDSQRWWIGQWMAQVPRSSVFYGTFIEYTRDGHKKIRRDQPGGVTMKYRVKDDTLTFVKEDQSEESIKFERKGDLLWLKGDLKHLPWLQDTPKDSSKKSFRLVNHNMKEKN